MSAFSFMKRNEADGVSDQGESRISQKKDPDIKVFSLGNLSEQSRRVSGVQNKGDMVMNVEGNVGLTS